jgi:hypothetical protein
MNAETHARRRFFIYFSPGIPTADHPTTFAERDQYFGLASTMPKNGSASVAS